MSSPKLNWNVFLSKRKRDITAAQWKRATLAAWDWPTCACGALCKKLPRERNGRPKDHTLGCLGEAFAEDIEVSELVEARKTFAAIERRTAYLLSRSDNTNSSTPKEGSL